MPSGRVLLTVTLLSAGPVESVTHVCCTLFLKKKKKQTKGLEKSQWPGRLPEYWNYWPCPVLCWLALQFHRSLYSSPVGKKPFKPGREGGPPSLGSLGCPGCFIGTPTDNWYLRLPPAHGSEESCPLHRAT